MTAGDVTVELVENFSTTSVDLAVTNLRNSANDKWLMASTGNGKDILIVHIEEDA